MWLWGLSQEDLDRLDDQTLRQMEMDRRARRARRRARVAGLVATTRRPAAPAVEDDAVRLLGEPLPAPANPVVPPPLPAAPRHAAAPVAPQTAAPVPVTPQAPERPATPSAPVPPAPAPQVPPPAPAHDYAAETLSVMLADEAALAAVVATGRKTPATQIEVPMPEPTQQAAPSDSPRRGQNRAARAEKKHDRKTAEQRRTDQAPLDVRIALEEILGNATLDRDGITLWFRLPPFRWGYVSDTRREAMLAEVTRAVSGLGGRDLHLRITNRPVDIAVWAHDLDQAANPPDRRAWREQLDRSQGYLAGERLSKKMVYLGVRIADRRTIDRIITRVAKGRPAEREFLRYSEVRDAVATAMRRPGLDAVEATHAEVVWLVDRSVGLHLPGAVEDAVGNEVLADDMGTFTDGVEVTPWTRKLAKVTALPSRTGEPDGVTRYVAVLSIGRMEDLRIPESHSPWLAMAGELGFPVEVSAHIKILSGAEARRAVEGKLRVVREQEAMEDEFGLDADPELQVVREQAIRMRHEMTAGDSVTASRAHGVFRLAVYGDTPETAMSNARKLIAHYHESGITIEWPNAQVAMLREFVPGARAESVAHTRRGPLYWLATAVPHLDDRVGDVDGIFLGHTCEFGHPVMWDMWAAMLRAETTGLSSLVAEPGGGKSALMGRLAYWSALMGVSTTIFDPSGPLAELCYIPELRAISKHIDLAAAPDGSLNPFAVLPMPRRADYDDQADYLAEAQRVRGERVALARDVVKMLLPPEVRKSKRTELLIAEAFRDVAENVTDRTPHLGDVLLALDVLAAGRDGAGPDEDARHMAIYLRGAASEPLGRLLFAYDETAGAALDTDKTLVVFTMAGLVMPIAGTDPSDWTDTERFSVPLLHLAIAATTRRIYGQPMHVRKFVGLDECHWLKGWSSALALWNRLSRDSRKWRLRVIAASQVPADVDAMSALSGESFIGILTDGQAQVDACRLLRIPEEYAEELGTPSPPMPDDRERDYREFLMRDRTDRVGRIVIRLDDCPNLAIALRPGPKPWPSVNEARLAAGRARLAAVGQPAAPATREGVA